MNNMQILIVDDSKAMRMVVAECVSTLGYNVIHAENGAQALAYVKEHDVDLILMDVEMPNMNGFEATKAIREYQVDDWFPIIFLTTKVDDESYQQCILAGGDAYLAKPINPLRLRLQIRAMERIYFMRKKLQVTQSELVKANEALRYLSFYDPLTGLANRRYFDETLTREFLSAQRNKEPLSLMMCDIDFFKAYNDSNGHLSGDACLQSVASSLAAVTVRPTDLACRYGGEEFSIILPNTDLKGAKQIAEKIKAQCLERKIAHAASTVSDCVTLSIGVATYNGQFKHCNELTKAADDALYFAKENGRNRVEIFS